MIVLALLSTCSKGKPDLTADYGYSPRKEAPANFAGEWMYTTVSGPTVHYSSGHSEPYTAFGAVFHINPNGTGFEVISSGNTIPYQSGERVEVNGTYEIDRISSNEFVLKFYPTSGKVYDNNRYKQDLSAEKLYPKTFHHWSCTLGSDERGTFFESGGMKYYKTK